MKRYGIERHLTVSLSEERGGCAWISDSMWEACVHAAGARVLSLKRNPEQRAFLLSESTLLVRSRDLVLITCGGMSQTAFLHALCDSAEDCVSRLRYSLIAHPLAQAEAEIQQQRDIEALRSVGAPLVVDPLGAGANQRVLSDCIGLQEPDAWIRDVQGEARALASEANFNVVDDFVFSPAGYSLNALRGGDYLAVHASIEGQDSFLTISWDGELHQGLLERVRSGR